MRGQSPWFGRRSSLDALDRDTDHMHVGMHVDAGRVAVEDGHDRRWLARRSQPLWLELVQTLALAHGADYLVRMNRNKAGVGQEGTGGMQFPERDQRLGGRRCAAADASHQ